MKRSEDKTLRSRSAKETEERSLDVDLFISWIATPWDVEASSKQVVDRSFKEYERTRRRSAEHRA